MRYWIITLLILLITACQNTPEVKHYTQVRIGDTTVHAVISATAAEKTKGLQHVRVLPPTDGMLFIYQPAHVLNHWMKLMLIPLDMIFIDQNKKIVNIIDNIPVCQQDPCPQYRSNGPAMYVLEVNAGFAARHHWREGMHAVF